MWTYVKLALGVFMILSCIAGVIAMLDGTVEESATRIVENGVNTEGVVESRTRHFVAARYGKIGGAGVYYTMAYRFTTQDGRTFSDEIKISKEQAYSVKDGQTITVRYYSEQPSINSPLGFEEYMTRKDVENLPIGTMIASTGLFFLIGTWLTWSSWRRIRPARAAASPLAGTAAARMTSIGRPSGPAAGAASGAVSRPSGGFGRR